MKRFISCVCLLLTTVHTLPAFTPESDGIYGVITVTYRNPDPGDQEIVTEEIAIQLFYSLAPVTSANFIGLAEGTLEWYDFETQEVRGGMDNPEPFYDGLIFHRVVPNFVIQTGSRNGLGSDGPGWQIPNEIHPELNHIGGGVVSMANSSSGAQRLNSGGSQFFITMAQFPEGQAGLDALNGRHSIFAQVVEGQLIAQEIARAPTSGSTPIENWTATVDSIEIIRVGAVANAWDPAAYWEGPVFSNPTLTASNRFEDRDGDPDTAPIRTLKVAWERNRDSQYFLEDSNDLENWRVNTIDRGVTPYSTEENPVLVERAAAGDVIDRRHFYRLLEANFPPIPSREGERLVLNFDPVEFDENFIDFIPFTPETLTVDFYDENEGGFQIKRSDSDTMEPIGNVIRYENYPLGTGPNDREQVLLSLDSFSTIQAYLSYDTATTGTAYMFYPNGRPEGNFITNALGPNVTGTFTIEAAQPRRVPENKNSTRVTLTTTFTPNDTNQDPVTNVFTINLFGLLDDTNPDLSTTYEGNYKVSQNDTEFLQTGALFYQWLDVEGQIYLLVDFDFVSDMQILLENDTAGDAEIFFTSQSAFQDATFTAEPGEPKPEPVDKDGDKLILVLETENADLTITQSTINIDFYDDGDGGYEATRTDSEVNQFGDLAYEWIATSEETRVDLVYDAIQPMQVYLTPQPNGVSSMGTAKVHFPQSRAVVDATYDYIVDGWAPRPVNLDQSGKQITFTINSTSISTLIIDLSTDFAGTYNFARPEFFGRPTGNLIEYQWFERPDGMILTNFIFDRLPPFQALLDPVADTAEILYTETGTVNTVPYSIGDAVETPQSENRTGTRLLVDINTATVDTLQIDLNDSSTGDWLRTRPNDGGTDSGSIDEYAWLSYPSYDQVNVVYDFFLNTQIFLDYNTATSGTATVYFITGGNFEEGTFEITTAD